MHPPEVAVVGVDFGVRGNAEIGDGAVVTAEHDVQVNAVGIKDLRYGNCVDEDWCDCDADEFGCVEVAEGEVGTGALLARCLGLTLEVQEHPAPVRGVEDLAGITLMSDGASVYECTSNDEVIDLLQGGQGVFGIAIGGVWREIEGSLAELPSERAVSDDHSSSDELSARRRAREVG